MSEFRQPRVARADGIPVLVYHAVAETPPPGLAELTVTPRAFAAQVEAIVASGREPITIAELALALRGERALPARAVAITFDDGFDDTLAAVERLASVGLRATVFVTSERVGRPGGIPAHAVEALLATGAELGAHSVTHPHLDELSRSDATREIADSRRDLEDRCQRPVGSFAYPYGAYDRRVRASVIDAGFSAAAAAKNALSHRADDPFAIARWTVGCGTSAPQLARVLECVGPPLAWRRERLRTRAYREYRRARRRSRVLRAAFSGRRAAGAS